MKVKIVSFILSTLLVVGAAQALPWDRDMYEQESLVANEVARNPVKGTVPLGRKPFTLTTEEADKQLTNPTPFALDSVWRGQRVYNSNCSTCHGVKGDAKAPTGALLPVPNLLEAFYKERTDGRVFGIVYNGGAVMPRYGYKFSPREIWDVVNYLRFLQGRDVEGMKRPQ